jgi:hypothetical protein
MMPSIDPGISDGILGVMQREEPDGDVLSDIRAHDYVMGLPMHRVVRELADLLGATTVAVIGGVSETRAVAQWMTETGREPQRPHVVRFALQIAMMLSNFADREYARAWFHGSNPRLDDATPMLLLRDSPLEVVQGPIAAAARAFAKRREGPRPG